MSWSRPGTSSLHSCIISADCPLGELRRVWGICPFHTHTHTLLSLQQGPGSRQLTNPLSNTKIFADLSLQWWQLHFRPYVRSSLFPCDFMSQSAFITVNLLSYYLHFPFDVMFFFSFLSHLSFFLLTFVPFDILSINVFYFDILLVNPGYFYKGSKTSLDKFISNSWNNIFNLQLLYFKYFSKINIIYLICICYNKMLL